MADEEKGEEKGKASLYQIGKGRRGKKKNVKDGKPKQVPALIRVQQELGELDLPHNVQVTIPNKENLSNFHVLVTADTGLWKGATYTFNFVIGDDYPYKAPKVTLVEKIYHPNIDLQGNVCLNLLKADWRPILTVQQVIHGLIFLFLEPNPDDPLNIEAAKIFREDYNRFQGNVRRSLQGGNVEGAFFQAMKLK